MSHAAVCTLVALGLVLGSCGKSDVPAPSQPAPPKVLDRAALVRGELPAGPEMTILYTRCLICHSIEYVTQQRLNEAGWLKTLTKMQKWGSPLTDAERDVLAPFLARTWAAELPDLVVPSSAAPPGATPL